ncbi:MAG: tetratricopeptide repeat protein [bacterium]
MTKKKAKRREDFKTEKELNVNENQTVEPKNPKEKDSEALKINFKNKKFLAAIPFVLAILIYACIWLFEPGEPVVDPWFAAVKLVDSSQKATDPTLKQNLLNEGGNELRHLVKIHPYHARVRFFLGYYYFVTQNWDSSLSELKEAARLDSGSTINSVWPNAHDLISKAAINKSVLSMNQGKLQEAKQLLLDAYPYYPQNPLLNKYIGNVYFNLGEYENAFRHFSVSLQGNQNDADVANMLGVLYKMKGDMNNAKAYFQRALQINPNHQGAKTNLSGINQ